MVTMSDSDSVDLMEQVKKDNLHFKALLDLVPPQAYFSQESKSEIWESITGDGVDGDKSMSRKKKKPKLNPFTAMSVTQITELRQQGVVLDGSKQPPKLGTNGTEDGDVSTLIDEKQKAKKLSRSSKAKKGKDKELQRREGRLEELKERLRIKLEEIRACKSSGNVVNSQERKKLKRQEKKINAKLKDKSKKSKEERLTPAGQSLKAPPQSKILNENGQPVKSKFDFSIISFGKTKQSSELRGRDYKRLLEKVERRNEKVKQLKEKDAEAGTKLEEKFQWQAVLSRAKGEKVKDDVGLLKKAAKRKEQVKEKKQKKWGNRVKTVEGLKQKRQDKREANLEKRKDAKWDKKRKKLIKKGRIIPGF